VAHQILVVDDEPGIRHMLGQMLADEHFEVNTAGSVLEALGKLEARTFDLAIVDLFLPDVNGLNLAEAIRVLDPGTPVILITAYGTPSFEAMASHPAISHYIHKPFTLERLLGLVRQLLTTPEWTETDGADALKH
jgi:DNA-binding NtrC family response regulator